MSGVVLAEKLGNPEPEKVAFLLRTSLFNHPKKQKKNDFFKAPVKFRSRNRFAIWSCWAWTVQKPFRNGDNFQQQQQLGSDFKCFLCSSLFGEDFHLDLYSSDGLKPPTRKQRRRPAPNKLTIKTTRTTRISRVNPSQQPLQHLPFAFTSWLHLPKSEARSLHFFGLLDDGKEFQRFLAHTFLLCQQWSSRLAKMYFFRCFFVGWNWVVRKSW